MSDLVGMELKAGLVRRRGLVGGGEIDLFSDAGGEISQDWFSGLTKGFSMMLLVAGRCLFIKSTFE